MTTQITRRGLLGMFAAGAAAAVLPSGIIMPVKRIIVPSRLRHLAADFDGDAGTVIVDERDLSRIVWKPELTLVVASSRGPSKVKLLSQPSFLHVTQLPVMPLIRV